MTIPRGAYHVVSGTAITAVTVTKSISAGKFTDHSNSTVVDIDNSEGWPTVDVVCLFDADSDAPAGSSLELYMTCRDIFGSSGTHEADPSDTNLAGFIGSREISGRSNQHVFFTGIPVPRGKYRILYACYRIRHEARLLDHGSAYDRRAQGLTCHPGHQAPSRRAGCRS